MHSETDIRLVKCLDGLHYSFQLLHYNYKDLHELCSSIRDNQDNLIPALSRCWMIIDLTHRIREISQAIPGLSGRNNSLRKFLNGTNVAETYRHYIQHLREQLSKEIPNPFPVWGTLSWVDPNDDTISYLAIIGAHLPNTSFPGSVYDTVERKWVSKVTLSVGDLSFNFDPIYNTIKEFEGFIIPWLIGTYKPGITMKETFTIATIKSLK